MVRVELIWEDPIRVLGREAVAVTLGSNIWSLQTVGRLNGVTSELQSVFERLSTGQRINTASDDAAGLAIADSLRADSRVYHQAIRNLGDGISLLNIADSALENLSSILVRLAELSEQAANGTLGQHQRASLDEEAQSLSKEYSRILQATKFNGTKLLTGELSALTLQAGYSTLAMGTGGEGFGSGEFEEAVQFSVGGGPSSVGVGDFNGDGVLDLVTSDYLAGTASILLGHGDGNFAPRSSFDVAEQSAAGSVGVGDFDGDGILDLVFSDELQGSVNILLGSGDGSFSPPTSYSAGSTPAPVSVGDFNGDGVLDLATANFSDREVSVLLGNGDGGFASRTSYAGGTAPFFMNIGDFNGDGVLDLVVAAVEDDAVSVLMGKRGEGAASSFQVSPLLAFSLKSQADARQALPVFKAKLGQLAEQRGVIGAFQSRIGVAANTLRAADENVQAAESRIRDADVAHESSSMVRLNILRETATTVLSQANQQPALALQLLS